MKIGRYTDTGAQTLVGRGGIALRRDGKGYFAWADHQKIYYGLPESKEKENRFAIGAQIKFKENRKS